MRQNVKVASVKRYTHEGGRASRQNPVEELERTIATTMLFEQTFYEAGNGIAARIEDLCTHVKPEKIAELAIRARNDYKLRHAPLFLCLQLLRHKGYPTRDVIATVVQRPDEMGELLALYWRNGRCPLAAQLKRGLAQAFGKFNEYQLSKWNRDSQVKLRDVMFMVHPKPAHSSAAMYTRLAENTLEIPDTWEVALSAGEDKRATWERLLSEGKLGYMALLMNLRNMTEANVDRQLVRARLLEGALGSRALPFRFVSAAKAAPSYAKTLSQAMLSVVPDYELTGDTAILVDVSGSMDDALSKRGTLTRLDAAGAMAVLLNQVCDSTRVFTFSNQFGEVPNHAGLALIEAISASQQHGGTYLHNALAELQRRCPRARRVVVITDEQSADGILTAWAPNSYIINVAPYAPGLSTAGGWCRINGWSERAVEWMALVEQEQS